MSYAQTDSFSFHYDRFEKLRNNAGPNDSVARVHLNKAYALMDTVSPDVRAGNVCYHLARDVYQFGDHHKALDLFFKASGIFEGLGDSCKYRNAMYNIGAVLYSMGDDLGAMRYYNEYERVHTCPYDTAEQQLFNYNMGILFDDLDIKEDAKKHFSRVQDLNDSTPKGMFYSLMSQLALDNYAFFNGDRTGAIEHHKNILAHAHISFYEEDIFYYGYGELGDFYLETEEYDSAEKYYQYAAAISDSLDYIEYQLGDWLNMAELCLKKNEVAKARDWAEKALKATKELDYPNREMDVLKLLIGLDTATGNWHSAYERQDRVAEISDSLQVSKTRFIYLVNEIAKANRSNKELGKDFEEAQGEAKRKTKLLISAGVLLLAFAVLLVIIAGQRRKLYKLNSVLTESNKSKDKVVATLAHDVRAPLVGVEGLLTLLRREIITEEEKNEVLNSLESGMHNLKTNVETMLDWALAQLKTSKPNQARYSIYEVFSEVVGYCQPIILSGEIVIELDVKPIDLQVMTDRGHMLVILRNLVGNAVKFSKKGGKILLSAREEGPEMVIAVQDWGRGIREEDMHRILGEEVYTKNSENGYGLGLRLVKEYVALNKGKISLESEFGKGTTFTLRFPV